MSIFIRSCHPLWVIKGKFNPFQFVKRSGGLYFRVFGLSIMVMYG